MSLCVALPASSNWDVVQFLALIGMETPWAFAPDITGG